VIGALILITAAPAEIPPPTMRGPHFACRMADRSGEVFTISGQLGAGRRFNVPTATLRPTWSYRFSEGQVEDSQAGFAGTPILASSSTEPGDFRVMVRYAAGRNGRRIDIGDDGRARLTEDNSGDVLADGTCRLEFEPRVASMGLETRR
jgi:hypothetical protein